MKSLLTKSIACACLALTALATQADPVTWTLNNVTFDDGGAANGWFIFDATQWNVDQNTWGVYGDFDITTTAGSQNLSWHYSSTDDNNFAWHIDMWGYPNSLSWAANGADQPWIDFMFSQGLTDAGGTASVVGGYEGSDINTTVYRTLTGGSVTTEAANALPEPGALGLVSAALFGLCITARRSRQSRRTCRT